MRHPFLRKDGHSRLYEAVLITERNPLFRGRRCLLCVTTTVPMTRKWSIWFVPACIGTACCALILIAWVVGLLYQAAYWNNNWFVSSGLGEFTLQYQEGVSCVGLQISPCDLPIRLFWHRLGLHFPQTAPYISRNFTYVVLPYWILLTIIGLPTAGLIWLHRWTIRHRNVVRRSMVRVERRSLRASLVVSAIAYFVLLVSMPLVLEVECDVLMRNPYVQFEDFVGFEGDFWTRHEIVFLTIIFVIPYIGARLIYAKLRWRRVIDGNCTCLECAYDLTGNVSGRCPECGTPVESQSNDRCTEKIGPE